MDLLLILIYVAVAYAVFRIFKIPVNGFTLLTAGAGRDRTDRRVVAGDELTTIRSRARRGFISRRRRSFPA